LVGFSVAVLAPSARADELQRLYAQILRDPSNVEANLRYAELAEQRGELRKALQAYERVYITNPGNAEAARALQRVRRKMQPNTTQLFAELGASWETNPRRVSGGSDDDGAARARFTIVDERGVGEIARWRTLAQLLGDVYFSNGDLSYGFAGAYTGPVIDLTPAIAMHVALGGSAAYFDHRLLYSEAIANVLFEGFVEDTSHSLRVRGGYREYNDFFPSDNGFYVEAVARHALPNVASTNDVLIASPWFRWSDIDGVGFSTLTPTEQVQPGRYIEYGGRLEYYRRLFEWLTVGANISVHQRDYARTVDIDFFPPRPIDRRDLMLAPGATVILHHIAGSRADLRIDYRYEHNDSNVAVRDYINHLTTVMLLAKF
jgi:hypothetical protein